MRILSYVPWLRSNYPGVYRIRNKVTGREYIGATARPIWVRWNQHIGNLECGRHKNRLLQSDWAHYGASAFEFSVIETVRRGHDAVFERERYWQDLGYDRSLRYNPANETGQRTYTAQASDEFQVLLPAGVGSVAELIEHLRSNPVSDTDADDLLSRLYRNGERMVSDDDIAQGAPLKRPANGW